MNNILSRPNSILYALLSSPENLSQSNLLFWTKLINENRNEGREYDANTKSFFFNKGYPAIRIEIGIVDDSTENDNCYLIEISITSYNTSDNTSDTTSKEVKCFECSFDKDDYNGTLIKAMEWFQLKKASVSPNFNRKTFN
jgi:hypothetical protein